MGSRRGKALRIFARGEGRGLPGWVRRLASGFEPGSLERKIGRLDRVTHRYEPERRRERMEATHAVDWKRNQYVVAPPPMGTTGGCRNVHVRPLGDLPHGWEWEDIPPPPGEEYVAMEVEKTPPKKKPTVVIEAEPVAAPEVHVDEEVKRFVPPALQRRKAEQKTTNKKKKTTETNSPTDPNDNPNQQEAPDQEYASFVEDLKNIGAYE